MLALVVVVAGKIGSTTVIATITTDVMATDTPLGLDVLVVVVVVGVAVVVRVIESGKPLRNSTRR